MLKSQGDGAERNLNNTIFGIFIVMHYKKYVMNFIFNRVSVFKSDVKQIIILQLFCLLRDHTKLDLLERTHMPLSLL